MSDFINSLGVKLAYSYLNANPDKNMPKILNIIEKFDKELLYSQQINFVKNILNDKNNIWYKYMKDLWTNIDEGQRKKLFENFIINASIKGSPIQKKAKEKYNCNIPWTILMDPTATCNLKCIGCWAAEYGQKKSMSYEQLDSIILQGKEIGIYFYIFSGGEPLVRKNDIIKLCYKHNDCVFLSFTNGTLIDEKFANDMLEVKNFIPAISVEGFEKSTDSRRGKGTYAEVIKSMNILKSRKLAFGISCCYTSKNYEIIGSEQYFDDMIDKGAKFAWFFTYMPVGEDAVPDLMVTPEQRKFMYEKIREYRTTKAIFTMDFWNDGEFVGGCIAGGRNYFHINANGDAEPCAFIHYSNYNIKDKSLLEILKSPLFLEYQKNQPFNSNHLRPCPLLDNPEKLKQIVKKSNAKSTDMLKPENIDNLTLKCEVPSKRWAPVANKLWQNSHNRILKKLKSDKVKEIKKISMF